MTYKQALKSTVTKAQAIREIKKHCLDPKDFFKDIGDRPKYKGSVIIRWLGY